MLRCRRLQLHGTTSIELRRSYLVVSDVAIGASLASSKVGRVSMEHYPCGAGSIGRQARAISAREKERERERHVCTRKIRKRAWARGGLDASLLPNRVERRGGAKILQTFFKLRQPALRLARDVTRSRASG